MGYIEDYVEYASALTSAPKVFHEIIAHLQISAFLHRDVFIPMDFGLIRPNLWVLIVGPSTKTRKSTAINLGYEIIHGVDRNLRLPYDFSPEALMRSLSTRSPCMALLVRDELGGLISAMNRKSYMAAVKDVLMNIYDCPAILKRSLMKKEFVVENVYMTVLGATTPDRLYRVAKRTDVTDGFLARFITCYSDDYEFRPVRMRTTDDLFSKSRLITDLRKVQKAFEGKKVEVRLDKAALDLYNDWSRQVEEIETSTPVLGRLTIYVLKLALTHYISDDVIPQLTGSSQLLDSEQHVGQKNIAYAIKFVNDRLETTFDLYRHLENSNNLEKVRDIVYTHGPIGHSEALRKSKLKAREFRDCISTLIESHEIEMGRDERGNTHYLRYLDKGEKVEEARDDKDLQELEEEVTP